MAIPLTGDQYEITAGEVAAVVTEVGAGLRTFTIGGRPYVEAFPLDSRPPRGAGTVLVPWPNRTAGGRWTWQGATQQLALNEPAAGNAIHGLLRYAFYEVVDRAADTITLAARVAPQPGWPVPLATQVRYAVAADGLTVTHTVTNIGAAAVPFGVGAHPYIRVGDTATDDGRPLKGLTLDDAFGGCVPDDGLVRHRLLGPDGGLEVWADPDFGWVQVFTPDDHPGRGRAVAVEPMTCPPDALNSGTDLITLAPEETWQGSWGLRPV
jgi:aldose 1-epimerase